MLGIFDDINTIECLKCILVEGEGSEEQVSTKKLECYVKRLYNMPNASQVVTEWINTFIEEYNSQYDDLDSKKKSFYNRCLYKTIDYFLPFLATYEKMCALINMCSLADDEDEANKDFHQEFFEISVYNATEYANEIHFLEVADNDKMDNGNNFLFLLGFFNFRIQNYDAAIAYLKPCVEYRVKEVNNDDSIRLYIKSIFYLAESYEYNKSDLNNALKQLIGIDGIQLKNHLANSKIRIKITKYIYENYPHILSDKKNIQYIKDLYDFFYSSTSDVPPTYKVFQLEDIDDSLKSFVHVTAHCLSEYASECMARVAKMNESDTKEIRIYSLLQQISRFLIDWLVAQDDSYVTCQATIRAENDACPEAIDILIKRLSIATQKMDRAELQFYIFYFAEQELGISNNKNNLISIFEQYGAEFQEFISESKDTNALFHYLVIKFKFLLKKSAQDILQRNELVDYTELDKVYYQINDCRKKPLPHVFRELLEESDRLINAYLLLREYRYLLRKSPDLCNVKEFYNRLGLKSYNTTTNREELTSEILDSANLDNTDDDEIYIEDSNIIKKLIDEIETRKRILILSPVKAAPSCSSDYVPINQLYKLVTCKNVSDEYKSIQKKFQQVAAGYINKKGMNKILQCDNMELVKWVIYYDITIPALFIYYSEHKYKIRGEMLRANLNGNEESHLKKLFKSLKQNFFIIDSQVDCNLDEHKKIYGSGGTCTTWIIKGSDVNENRQLLEILVFSEFDFYSSSPSNRINDNDYILFSLDEQRAAKYKIVCFNKLPDTKEKGICNYCLCVDEEDMKKNKENANNLLKTTTNYDKKCIYNGVEVDLNDLKNRIEDKMKSYRAAKVGEQAQAYIFANSLYERICKCCDGDCDRKENKGECDLIEACVESKICIL